MYTREIQKHIQRWLFQQKILILYGARQVGKTTLAKQIVDQYPDKKSAYFNCEDPLVKLALVDKSAQQIHNFMGNADIVVLDEAQTVPDIGKILKIYNDQYPQTQILATGSSSFDLSNQMNEPLTGRSIEFILYPLSIAEIQQYQNHLSLQSNISKFLLYGLYPEIVDKDNQTSQELILDLSKKYLFKDILNFEGVKNSVLITKILKALAYQLGSEVSYTELAQLVGSNKHTVEQYIHILEQLFIVRSLPAYTTNQRNEISKSRKVYFYDLGIRNALIEDFGDIELRNDKGSLWENFAVMEFIKKYRNSREMATFYFWRTYTQQEVDLVIKKNANLSAYEFKWTGKKKTQVPSTFKRFYPGTPFEVVTKDNWIECIGL